MKKFSLKNVKLGARLSIILGFVILIGFVILSIVSVEFSGRALENITNHQMNQICETNTQKVNIITNVTKSIADSITDALDVMYGQKDNILTDSPYKSAVNNQPLSKSRYDAETAIINNIWSAVEQNESFMGAGLFLEPNAFSSKYKEYSTYVYKKDLSARKLDPVVYADYKDKDYYTYPKNDLAMSFSDAYKDSKTGDYVVSASYPIINNGKFMGIVLIDIKSDCFQTLDTKSEKHPSMYVNIVNGNKNIMYSTHTDVIGKNFAETESPEVYEDIAALQDEGVAFQIETPGANGKIMRYYTPVEVGNYTWWLQTALTTRDLNSDKTILTIALSIVSIIILVLLIIVLILQIKNTVKPILKMQKAAEEMASGSLHVEIDYESKDEIGMLADSMRTLMSGIQIIINDLVYVLGEMANGNFTVKCENPDVYVGDYAPLIISTQNIVKKLNETLSEIKISSNEVNSGADQVSSAAQALSQGATEQASSVEELSATMTEIADKIKNNAEKSEKANQLSVVASEEVAISNNKMKEMSIAMADITEKSNEIGKIIKTIDDIAFQTNILALNAAVEAARAGEAGKGFAVVADEVRNLASKSAEAAKNTTALIENAIDAIANGDKLATETANSLLSVADNTNQVAALIGEISTASIEQATGVSQINIGLEQISSVVQTNSATAEESAAASEELSGQSTMMNQMISKFKLSGDVELSSNKISNTVKEYEPIAYENDGSKY